ncbi:hypothetical protein [Virgibacillus halodenitrificans]|uniref:hypothetical protein n=1 Tax=Virgibacillus halodenitrificans TaxID=1482 RepID=UPI000760D6BD
MTLFFIIAPLTFILLTSLNWFFGRSKSPLAYLFPISVIFISMILIIIAFLINDLEGIGIIGFALFIGAAVALLITAIISSSKELKKHLF